MTGVAEERELVRGASRLVYRLHRSRRKTLEISVTTGGLVEVRAPAGPTIETIEQRLLARFAWIRRKVVARHPLEVEVPRRYVSGENHRYLGRQYRLSVRQGERAMVRAHGGRLHVEVCEPRDQDQVRCAIVGWFRERARTVIPQRVSQLTSSPAFAELQPTAVTVRTMKTRWGSCSASGRLLLNSQLIALPTSLIDYAIAHELCHLKERKHGPRFERLLARVMPDWRVRHECLTKASANCLGDRALPWNLRQQWAMTPDERFDIAKTLRDRVYGADAPDVRESERAKERRLGHLPE